jgi:hypothetical protein
MPGKTEKLRTKFNERGFVLMVVLVLLVVLCTLAYALTLSVSAYRKRSQYMIDYQAARYACDSAVKYALATLQDINEPNLIARPNEPDFSDLFTMNEQEYRLVLKNWAEATSAMQKLKYQKKIKKYLQAVSDPNSVYDINEPNGFNLAADINNLPAFLTGSTAAIDPNDPNNLQIPGPYGPAWPLITEPLNLVIGDAAVAIEIHDENAKYPIGLMMVQDVKLKPQILAGFETLCSEWMDVNRVTVDKLADELEELNKVKEYKPVIKDVKITKREPVSISRRSARTRSSRRARYRTRQVTIPAEVQMTDYSRLYHSSLLDTEALARPVIIADDRTESALKYISMWPVVKVNINSAPRNVLEAVFALGGMTAAVDITDGVIQRRRIKPFDDPNEMRHELFRYSDSIEKCRKYITTKSDFFTIHITVNRGLARASAVIAVRKEKGIMKKIAVLSG